MAWPPPPSSNVSIIDDHFDCQVLQNLPVVQVTPAVVRLVRIQDRDIAELEPTQRHPERDLPVPVMRFKNFAVALYFSAYGSHCCLQMMLRRTSIALHGRQALTLINVLIP